MLIKYPSPPPGRPGFVGLPQAEVRIAQASDGRWMWAISFWASQGGEGFAPMEKWGRFADTCDAAVSAGIDELEKRLLGRREQDAHTRLLLDWIESLRAPAQPDLFGVAA